MSRPLEGVRFAATYIDEQTESDLISKIRSLGGDFHHKMDNSVKFLVVGKRYTKKYDFALTHQINLISSETFFSVYVHWRSGEDLNFVSQLIEMKMKPFDGELICLSNMDSRQKEGFHELIAAGGGRYSIAFARVNTILVSPQASGRKIDGARKWGTPIVHPKWISDSMKFGAALNPDRYNVDDPNAVMEPPTVVEKPLNRGALAGSSASAANNYRSEEHSAPVLKRRRGDDLLFNAPLAKKDRTSVGSTLMSFTGPPLFSSGNSVIGSNAPPLGFSAEDKQVGIFKGVRFTYHNGFDSRQLGILNRAIKSLEGIIDSMNSDYLILNSTSPMRATTNPGTKLITEWALERSMYLKRNCLEDIWSRPVFKQPAQGFQGLSICISGFQGIEQRHATLLTKMLGATFEETLKKDRNILIAASNRAHKVPYAIRWQIPVVSIDWLWQSALQGRALPLDEEFVLDGKGSRPVPKGSRANAGDGEGASASPEPVNDESRDPSRTSLLPDENEDEPTSYVRYHDDDAEARAQMLLALGEKPSSLPEAEPETAPAVSSRLTRYRHASTN